jgi:hypothetical protein
MSWCVCFLCELPECGDIFLCHGEAGRRATIGFAQRLQHVAMVNILWFRENSCKRGPKLEIFVAEFFLHNPSRFGQIDDLGTRKYFLFILMFQF